MSRVVATRLPVSLRRAGLITLACSAALLSACGGGDRKNFFNPDRVVAFGDENSAFTAYSNPASLQDANGAPVTLKGFTYTVQSVIAGVQETCDNIVTPTLCSTPTSNPFDANVAVTDAVRYLLSVDRNVVTSIARDAGNNTQRTSSTIYSCDTPRTWVQIVAGAYGKGFSGDCPLDTRGGAVSYATLGAKTADVIAQINAHRGELNSRTVVTVMVGQNDILEQYAVARAGNESGAIATLQGRADAMAAAIKDIIGGTGAKVVLALTPDLGESPKAHAGGEDPALLRRLTVAYNERLYVRGLGTQSGRSLAGVNPDSYTNPTTRSNSYTYRASLCKSADVLRPDGTAPANDDERLSYCTTQYLVSGGSASTYIWADATRAAPLLHSLIGVQGFSRAREQF